MPGSSLGKGHHQHKIKPFSGLTAWPSGQASKSQVLRNPDLAPKAPLLEVWFGFLSTGAGLSWDDKGPAAEEAFLFLCSPTLPALSTANFHLIIQPWGQHRGQGAGRVWEPPPSPRNWDVMRSFVVRRGILCAPISAWRTRMYSILASPRCLARNSTSPFYLAALEWGIQFGLLSLNLALVSSA